MAAPEPVNLAAALGGLRPKDKQPNSARVLNAWIAQTGRQLGSDGGRLGWLVASTITTAALQQAVELGEPLFLLKGGTLLQHRLPGTSRATIDPDGLIRGDIDAYFDKLDEVLQDLIHKQPGVLSTRVGYSGGDVPNATHRRHGRHTEVLEVVFDPHVTSFRDLLEFFYQVHDPTTLNRQGNDMGTSYRSAIFYTNEEQRRVAEETIADVEASGLWPGKVVTEVSAAGPFWETEPEH